MRSPFGIVGHQITFGAGGNAEPYQVNGWSNPETGYTWSIGPTSRLKLPILNDKTDWLIILRGEPLRTFGPKGQRLMISAGELDLGRRWLDRTFAFGVRIPKRLLKGAPLTLVLTHSDNRRPVDYGGLDTRPLAIRWERIEIIPVNSIKTVGPRLLAPPSAKQVVNWIIRATGQHLDNATIRSTCGGSKAGSLLTDFLLGCVHSEHLSLGARILGMWSGLDGISIDIESTVPEDNSLVHCTFTQSGSLRFGLPASWVGPLPTDAGLRMFVWHWLAAFPVLVAYARSGRTAGSMILNLADEAHGRGVAFCGKTGEALLLPDPYFLSSLGYDTLRRDFDTMSLEFTERKPKALWRGASTGYWSDEGLLGLPRVRLCQLSNRPENGQWLDAGFTNFVQLPSVADERQLRALGLEQAFIPSTRLPEWRFHVDIDGNTNSWPGLFQKLLSGSVVLKVQSPGGWRQWYYDRMEPGIHFVSIKSDLSDLINKIKFLTYNEQLAGDIAARGRQLAYSMTYETEVALALQTIEDAIIQEVLRSTGEQI